MNDDEDEDEELDRMRVRELLQQGRGIDLDAAPQMEIALLENPADIESRIKLLGNYFTK